MTTETIDFISHHREEVEAIMVKRDTATTELAKCYKTLEKTEFDPANGSPYVRVKKDIATLEMEITALTTAGHGHIFKIDKFNGVR